METIRTQAGQSLGIAGLVLGILAIMMAFIPCIGVLALVPGIIAIILSAFGLSRAQRHNGAKGLNIGALVVSIIGTLIASIWLLFFAGLASLDECELESAIEGIIEENYQTCNPDLLERADQLEQQLDSLDQDTITTDTTIIEDNR